MEAAPTARGGAAPAPGVPAAVLAAQRDIAAGQPAKAERALGAVLQAAPDDMEARYTLAVVLRHGRKWQAALDALAALLHGRPGFGRAHQEVGYNHIARREFASARAAFEEAVAADPSLINSWKCLVKLYEDDAAAAGANDGRLATARARVRWLGSLPAELLTVLGYLSEDRLADAERLCKHFLRANKTHVEGMRLLAEVSVRNKAFGEAEFLLESALEFAPEHRDARIQYLSVLLKAQKFTKACEQGERLLAATPDEAGIVRSLHAAALGGAGRNDEAIESYGRLLAAEPDSHLHPIALAHVHKARGDIDRAVELYRQASRKKPDHGDAYWSLANTKSYAFSDAEVERMAALEVASATAKEDRVHLCFALGAAWEGREDYERAFGYYRKGNGLRQADAWHSAGHLATRIESQIEVCTEALFQARAGVGCPARDPIFIVGLPRAGSTLLEQILASHSEVDGTMELHNLLNLAKRLRGRDVPGEPPRYPKLLAELDDDYFRRFGEQFIDDTRAYRGAAPRFIDKMPNNFFHVGLIRLILPNAKVIDARRHPMACCFSGFKQLFGEGQEFSYGLREIGNYYRQYVRLMDHWDAVLPGFVLRVCHERVVADLEGQVRRLLDFCGLAFEPACLAYHRTERSIRTPSAEQVRRPISAAAIDQWRNFEPWLGPLREGLGPDVVARYEAELGRSGGGGGQGDPEALGASR